MYKFNSLSIFAGAAVLAMLASCGGKEKEAATATDAAEELPIVDVLKVHQQDVAAGCSYTATVEAFKTINITTSTSKPYKGNTGRCGFSRQQGQKVVVPRRCDHRPVEGAS